ncbi:DUF3305 domain-containing protein [Halomonas sp. V046]|uniref:DUF3305 domain-containing protein n=1 Tax=Halomonas sp. V046 TaxID=3459611 RepID=UPI0040442C2F
MPEVTSHRSLSLSLDEQVQEVKGFRRRDWRVGDVTIGDAGPWVLTLQLTLTERAAYRFNLSADQPRLFVHAGHCDDIARPCSVSASQDVAAGWMDGEHRVLEVAMPWALRVWIEAYLAHHGEAPEEGRKKKRQGAGRAKDTPT